MLNIKCPQQSKPEATAANSVDKMDKKALVETQSGGQFSSMLHHKSDVQLWISIIHKI